MLEIYVNPLLAHRTSFESISGAEKRALHLHASFARRLHVRYFGLSLLRRKWYFNTCHECMFRHSAFAYRCIIDAFPFCFQIQRVSEQFESLSCPSFKFQHWQVGLPLHIRVGGAVITTLVRLTPEQKTHRQGFGVTFGLVSSKHINVRSTLIYVSHFYLNSTF